MDNCYLLLANDITITCSGKNMNYINEHLQTAINTLQDWSKTIGSNFSPKKTQGILFTRKTKLNPPPKLYLSNLEILTPSKY